MIRVLQCVNNMNRAGIETMLMNYYRQIDRTQIQFDFLMHRCEPSDYDEEIEKYGGRIYRAPRLYPQNYLEYFRYMKDFFLEHKEYKIIHSHIDAMSFLPLLAAKRAGIPIRIAHSHSTSLDKDKKYLLKQCFRMGVSKVANCYCACGTLAGEYLFGKKECHIIPNAIPADRFSFDKSTRLKKRQELSIENDFVVGHVGRFTNAKNHEFLVDIFYEIKKRNHESVLLLIGVGEKQEKIRNYVKRLGLSDSVRFLGKRNDVSELYQAMDIFVLPSLYEGVPVVGIEAQYAGLPCVFSDAVSKEVKFSPKCQFLSIEQFPNVWCEQIINAYHIYKREILVDSEWYDIGHASKSLMKFYMELSV